MVEIIKAEKADLPALSAVASAIVKEHYDPIVGPVQNRYMIEKFQSAASLAHQIDEGYRYFWVKSDGEPAGFMAFYPRDGKMYLSKFYLDRRFRGKGISRVMLSFVKDAARREGFSYVFLNVNRHNDETIQIYEHFGFRRIREEKNDIGNGYYMDDYVYECSCK